MIPSLSSTGFTPRATAAVPPQTGAKTTQPSAPQTARASAGEVAAGDIRVETAFAVDAAEQAAITPRLRDQETAERSQRLMQETDTPTGPPPAFRESPLERQARTAFELPEPAEPSAPDAQSRDVPSEMISPREAHPSPDEAQAKSSERAEASFSETRALGKSRESVTFNVAR